MDMTTSESPWRMALGREIEPSGSEDWLETNDWIDSLRDVARRRGPDRVSRLLQTLQIEAQRSGIRLPVTSQTPYVNTIPIEKQPPYPGDLALERRIKSIIRWNAMAMVVEANQNNHGIGGHISTYASAATLYEVGFNHFFRGQDHPSGGDSGVLPGALRAGDLCAGLCRGPPRSGSTPQVSTGTLGRTAVLSAPMVDG